uniref:Uncharacterized protein n=1 Tax=Stomoxys calcitrans TaxID=35570 RepID=A0A1I8NNR8_STOCA
MDKGSTINIANVNASTSVPSLPSSSTSSSNCNSTCDGIKSAIIQNHEFSTIVANREETNTTKFHDPKISFATRETPVRPTNRDRNVTLPTSYEVDYNLMDQSYSPSTLAEIYDDEFFDFGDSRREVQPVRINHKEGIFCCFITGVAIGLLLLMAYLLILLLDPITKTMEAMHNSFLNLTNSIIKKKLHNHNKPV